MGVTVDCGLACPPCRGPTGLLSAIWLCEGAYFWPDLGQELLGDGTVQSDSICPKSPKTFLRYMYIAVAPHAQWIPVFPSSLYPSIGFVICGVLGGPNQQGNYYLRRHRCKYIHAHR